MDSFKSNSETGYNSQRNNGQQNEFEGQSTAPPIVDYSTYTGRQAEGPLRRPNRSNTSANSDVINSLSQQTNLLSINENIRSNDNNYASISTPDVTNSWKTSGLYSLTHLFNHLFIHLFNNLYLSLIAINLYFLSIHLYKCF
jgi:hypothetical protein